MDALKRDTLLFVLSRPPPQIVSCPRVIRHCPRLGSLFKNPLRVFRPQDNLPRSRLVMTCAIFLRVRQHSPKSCILHTRCSHDQNLPFSVEVQLQKRLWDAYVRAWQSLKSFTTICKSHSVLEWSHLAYFQAYSGFSERFIVINHGPRSVNKWQ